MTTPAKRPTDSLRVEHARLLSSVHALGERVEKLHEAGTLGQLALAREVIDFVHRQVIPHARAEEYTLYPAADFLIELGDEAYFPYELFDDEGRWEFGALGVLSYDNVWRNRERIRRNVANPAHSGGEARLRSGHPVSA